LDKPAGHFVVLQGKWQSPNLAEAYFMDEKEVVWRVSS